MKQALLITIFILNTFAINACTCIGEYSYDFLKNIEGGDDYLEIYFGIIEWVDPDHEIMGNNVQLASMYVVDTLGKVSSLPGSRLTIFGQDGFSCAENLERLQPGALYVIALSKWWFGNSKDSFHLNGCGMHFQRLMLDGPPGISIENVKIKIRNSITAINQKVLSTLFVAPNPATEFLTVQIPIEGEYEIEIFNGTAGRVLSSRYYGRQHLQLDITELPPGLYFLRLRRERNHYLCKFVKSGTG